MLNELGDFVGRNYPPVPIPRKRKYFSLSPDIKMGQTRGLRAERLSGQYSDFGLHLFALNLTGKSDFSGRPCFHRGKPRR
jgi:hypothetical protein